MLLLVVIFIMKTMEHSLGHILNRYEVPSQRSKDPKENVAAYEK